MAVTYYALLTTIGAGKLANATALGTTLKITQLAVGDGGGNVPTPDASRTNLVNEVRRAPLNRLSVDPANSSQIIAEQVIPEDVGGWWIREMGLYDEAGALIAYANCAPSYKPQLAEGSGRTQTVRIVLIVSNAASVELKIDPSVVLATREYVDNSIVTALNRLDYKQSVRAATTASITLSGLQAVDGITLAAGDRVLVKNQSNPVDNGLYVVATGAWKRATDADESADVSSALTVSVESGTTQADSIWQLITDAPIVIDTTALVFKDITNGLARLASPALTGVPTAPTAPVGTKTSQLATTSFVRFAMEAYGVGAGQYQPNWPNTSLNDCTGVSSGKYRTNANNIDMPPGFNAVNIVDFSLRNGVDGSFQVVQTVTSAQLNRIQQRVSTGGNSAAPMWSDWREGVFADSPTFTGNPQAPTAAQFDNDTSIATTEFVQRALGSRSGYVSYSASQVLSTSHIGGYVRFDVAAAAICTLPAPSSVPVGASIIVQQAASSAAALTIRTPTGTIGGPGVNGAGGITQLVMQAASVAQIEFVADGVSSWIACNGSYGALFSGNGYQRLPSGLLLQWGIIPNVTTAPVEQVYPLAFPNSVLVYSVQVSISIGPAVAFVNAVTSPTPKTTIRAQVNTGTVPVGYIAIGY